MLTNKEYVESEGAQCPNCGAKSNQIEVTPTVAIYAAVQAVVQEKIECLTCRAAWWEVRRLVGYQDLELGNEESNPPDPKPTVVIEVEGGVASVLECPEWIEVEIRDRDVDPDWAEIKPYPTMLGKERKKPG